MLNISGLKLPMIGDSLVGGNVYFLDSGASGTNDGNLGTHPQNSPLATFAGALDKCTANNGDFIAIQPGHAETLTADVAIDVAGVTIIGIGNGDNAPTFTMNGATNGFNFTADDVKMANVRIVAGSSAAAGDRMFRVAASDLVLSQLRCELTYDMYHLGVVISGDNIIIQDSTFLNTITTAADLHPQTAILNIGGTNVIVRNCRFNDTRASKAERWRACVEGGALASNLVVEDCTFICRGQATSTRSAGASDGAGENAPTVATLYCRAISPSANTGVGTIFNMKYGYQIECYDVAAVNKKAVISPTMA
jgi:hypothetical protein